MCSGWCSARGLYETKRRIQAGHERDRSTPWECDSPGPLTAGNRVCAFPRPRTRRRYPVNFYAGQPEGVEPVRPHADYRGELNRIEHQHTRIRFAALGLPSPSDLNAAARPRLTGMLVDPRGRPRLKFNDDSHWTVPLVSSAVSLHTSDAITRKLAVIFHLMRRPLLLRPLPALGLRRFRSFRGLENLCPGAQSARSALCVLGS